MSLHALAAATATVRKQLGGLGQRAMTDLSHPIDAGKLGFCAPSELACWSAAFELDLVWSTCLLLLLHAVSFSVGNRL